MSIVKFHCDMSEQVNWKICILYLSIAYLICIINRMTDNPTITPICKV